MGPTDPLWLPDDRDVAVARFEYQESLCGQCGQPRDVCHDPELTGELYGRIQVCHFTAAVDRVRKREWDRFEGRASADTELDKAGAYVAVYRR